MALLAGPPLAYAGPLTAFAIAVAKRPSPGEVMRQAVARWLGFVGAIVASVFSIGLTVAAVSFVHSLASWSGPTAMGLWFLAPATGFALLASWVHGDRVLLPAAAVALGRAHRSRPPRVALAIGAIPVGIAVALSVPIVARVSTAVVVPSGLRLVAIVGGVLAGVIAGQLVSCALAVAIVSRGEASP